MSAPNFGLTEARVEKTRHDAELKALLVAERRGDLIDRQAAERAIEGRARFERDSWIGFAAAASATLAAELGGDPARTFAVLDRLVREHLTQLSETPFEITGKRRAKRL
jgi:hypothetical protein